jgi:predicted nucleic acid-binding protein
MDLELGRAWSPGPPRPTAEAATAVILLDTNAVLFLLGNHVRARPLARHAGRLIFSPMTLLELQFLHEVGRGRFLTRTPLAAVMSDPRWNVDDPPLAGVMTHAITLGWTRDPFDRLIAAHALYRGWRLATSDAVLLDNLPPRATLSL